MFRDQKRYGNDPTEIRRSKTKFDYPLSLIVHKGTKGTLVFACSWSDFFIQDADEWRDDAWDIIRRTPHLTYQILTKRPENIRSRLPDDWGKGWDNVWLGVSIETQEQIHLGWILANLPAKLRFLSIEPLLDKVDLFWLLAVEKISWLETIGKGGGVGVIIIALSKTARIVPNQWVFVVERLGKYSRSLEAGFHI